mmetsp:Transcript_110523/g.236170  ORF Transcript_110523/g.236170 Transcript_110523/m.236170 type:complete len:871 (+) Transcript_110523:107-2719(+)
MESAIAPTQQDVLDTLSLKDTKVADLEEENAELRQKLLSMSKLLQEQEGMTLELADRRKRPGRHSSAPGDLEELSQGGVIARQARGGVPLASLTSESSDSLAEAQTVGDVGWWRIDVDRAFADFEHAGLALRKRASMNAPIVDWVPSGKLFLARPDASMTWIELIFDGSPGLFMCISVEQGVEVTRKLSNEVTDLSSIHGVPMCPLAIAATRALINNTECDTKWWRCVCDPAVFVRSAPRTTADKIGIINLGQIVLATASTNAKWLKLMDDDFGPAAFVLIDGAELGKGLLMASETSVSNILGPYRPAKFSGIAHNRDTPDAVKNIATSVLAKTFISKVADEDLSIVELKRTSNLTRAFKVETKNDNESFLLRCESSLPTVVGQMPPLIGKARQAAARDLFLKHRLTPRLLSEGRGWQAEALVGESVKKLLPPDQVPIEIACLLACIHRLPTDWFKEWRNLLREHYSWIQSCTNGSHAWKYACSSIDYFTRVRRDALAKWASQHMFEPISPAGRRIVTCHGDFSHRKVLRTESGDLYCFDLENSCVTFAVEDLAQALCAFGNPSARRAFVQTYLVEAGYPARKEDVDALILDAECYSMAGKMLEAMIPSNGNMDGKGLSDIVLALNAIKEVRSTDGTSAILRSMVIEKGMSAAMEAWRELATRWAQVSAKATGPGNLSEQIANSRVEGPEPRFLTQIAMTGDMKETPPQIMDARTAFAIQNEMALDQEDVDVKDVISDGTGHCTLQWKQVFGQLEEQAGQRSSMWRAAVRLAQKTEPAHKTRSTFMKPHTLWIVVDSEASGGKGIAVRPEPSLQARTFPFKLNMGAIIEGLESKGPWLHYRRLRGDGPDFGWVKSGFLESLGILSPPPTE